VDTLHAQNYVVATEKNADGLTVVPREITLVWSNPKSFEYDGQYHSVKVVKAQNDYAAKSAISPAPSYTNEKKVNAGSYTAVAKLDKERAKNYKILNNSDKYSWTITKRPATIYANGNTITYGEAPADKGYYVDNKSLVKNVETGKLDSIGNVSFDINYKKNDKPGVYSITPVVTNLNPNYYIAGYKAGTLMVKDKVTELLAQGKTKGKKAAILSWNMVDGAASYDVYWSKCNTKKKKYTPKYIGTVAGNAFMVKKLKKGEPYKFFVVAKDASGNVIATSLMGHFIIGNESAKYTNPKTIVSAPGSVSVPVGGATQVATKITKVKKNKKLLNGAHTQQLRYFSANPDIATVTPNGVILGNSHGWCRVYAVATDGMWSVIEVNVN
jgi:hypothetical protein